MTKVVSVDIRTARLSGIGTYLTNVLPRVIALAPHLRFVLLGHQHDVTALGVSRSADVDFVSATSPLYSVQEQVELPRRIPNNTDLLWTPHYPLPVAYRGKLVVTVHDVFHLAMPNYVKGPFKRLYARTMFKTLRYKASAILTVSEFSKRELLRLTRPNNQAVTVTPLGVSEHWFLHHNGPSPRPKPYMLFVGNVKPHKNVRGLLEAFGYVKDILPHDLVIVGKKEGFITPEVQLSPLVERLGDRVTFAGYVSPEVLKQYMHHADAFVFPSFYEGFGLPPLEAMASGTPVIVSRRASLPEVCGDAALYCDPYDPRDIASKLNKLASDGALRAELRQRGRARAAQFSWENCARQTLSVIEQVLAS